MSTTEKGRTAVWRIARQRSSQRSAQNSPAGWTPSHRTARRYERIAQPCSTARVRFAATASRPGSLRAAAGEEFATGGSGGMAREPIILKTGFSQIQAGRENRGTSGRHCFAERACQLDAKTRARASLRPSAQYTSAEYGRVLDKYQIITSMSRLANPCDNAKCESLMKTLKREEFTSTNCRGMEQLWKNVAKFVDVFDNTQQLHSALGYVIQEQFEATPISSTTPANRDMSFARHRKIFQSDGADEQRLSEGGLPNHWLCLPNAARPHVATMLLKG
jgi:transposase InsO family protein